MISQRLRRPPGRRLVAVPSPAAAPIVWLLLRALVEQAIGHLANAWSLRRWRGLLYRVRDVFRAAGALICLGRWLYRVPT
jgi:hypothetical protein